MNSSPEELFFRGSFIFRYDAGKNITIKGKRKPTHIGVSVNVGITYLPGEAMRALPVADEAS